MQNSTPDSASNNRSKIVTAILLFCYFGFITIPELSRPYSSQFLFWLCGLPVVIGGLLVQGVRGGIGIWREKFQDAPPNPQNTYSLWLAILGLLWFMASVALANQTYFAYFHKKFDSQSWKTTSGEEGTSFQVSTRETMLEDLMENVIPGRAKTEIIEMLGQPDETGNVDGEETLFYYTARGIMEPECLFMTFDEQGIIKEYDLTTCG